MRLQIVADEPGSKHTGDSRDRGKGGATGVAGHAAGKPRPQECAPWARSTSREALTERPEVSEDLR